MPTALSKISLRFSSSNPVYYPRPPWRICTRSTAKHAHLYTFCRFGFAAYRHGWRWFQTAVSFSIEKLIVEQCTRTYTAQQPAAAQPHRQKRHGCRWFHVEARFALIANLAVKIGQGCPIFTGDKPHENHDSRSCRRGRRGAVNRRRRTPR